MAVVIKNMDMPESCYDCRFNRYCQVQPYENNRTYCTLSGLNTTDLFLLRHDMCPLEELAQNTYNLDAH